MTKFYILFFSGKGIRFVRLNEINKNCKFLYRSYQIFFHNIITEALFWCKEISWSRTVSKDVIFRLRWLSVKFLNQRLMLIKFYIFDLTVQYWIFFSLLYYQFYYFWFSWDLQSINSSMQEARLYVLDFLYSMKADDFCTI